MTAHCEYLICFILW